MFRGVVLASLLATVAAGPVLAQAPAYEWTGFYVGLNAGYGGNKFDYPVSGNFNGSVLGLSGTSGINGTAHLNSSGFLGGAQFGYNFQYPSGWFSGIEADIAGTGIEGKIDASGTLSGSPSGSAALSVGSHINYLGTLRVRGGLPVGDGGMVIYATGGLAYGDVDSEIKLDVASSSITPISARASIGSTQVGWTIGAGAEYPITDRFTFRAEYLYVDLGSYNLIAGAGSFLGVTGSARLDAETTANIFRAAVNYRFN